MRASLVDRREWWEERETPAPAEPAAAVWQRPSRLVAAWMVGVATVVAFSAAYLSLMVRMTLVSRQVESLEQQLAMEKRRGQALEVALARELSPEKTEELARVQLAMVKPKQVRLLPVEPAPATSEVQLARVHELSLQQVRRADERGRGPAGLVARVASALGQLLVDKPAALARQLPRWP
ncbi:hypothetical protein U7230_06370 [Carboxydochorda subterranea]|uniref:Cell division protein FtsL n=1 Tax=Carboxydichorda subterranea TaxID=3109565 RepID=A0ABZ1C1H9_9FIRM|nr:hypothetical protein [Limnochorda sp. L945t]WRP18621.1 hypothetical protein U7230_06370 [Limnochorda sp. L945t]